MDGWHVYRLRRTATRRMFGKASLHRSDLSDISGSPAIYVGKSSICIHLQMMYNVHQCSINVPSMFHQCFINVPWSCLITLFCSFTPFGGYLRFDDLLTSPVDLWDIREEHQDYTPSQCFFNPFWTYQILTLIELDLLNVSVYTVVS